MLVTVPEKPSMGPDLIETVSPMAKSISFMRIISTPILSTYSSESGTGFEPGPTKPVTPRVFLTIYQLSSVITILTMT